MRRLFLTALALTLAMPGSAAVAGPDARPSATANVAVGDFFFRPDYRRVEVGDTVTWTVLGNASPHTVNSAASAPTQFDSAELLPGQAFSFTFAAAGRYSYLCDIHPFMEGVVQVGPDTIDPAIGKARAKRGKRSVRVSFRLSETSKVSARLASTKKPGKVLRRTTPKRTEDGARSVSLRTKGLAPGRYRVTLTAKDLEGNTGTAKATFRIPD